MGFPTICMQRLCFAAMMLWLLWAGIGAGTAEAASFDCARASLKVDFVICRSEDGRHAIADLTAAWDALVADVPPDRKATLLTEQRQWIKAYALACGLDGRGQPGPDPAGRMDRCVVAKLRERTATLQATAVNPIVQDVAGFLASLYAPYKAGRSTAISESNVDHYFAPALAQAFRDSEAESMDGDPLVSQSQEVASFSSVNTFAKSLDANHAHGEVSLSTRDNPSGSTIGLDLLRTERGWRIEDIHYPPATDGTPQSLFRLLSDATPHQGAPDCVFHPIVTVDTQHPMAVGDWLPITWRRCAPPARLETPTFLVITVPDEVRLRGVGFYALRPMARAPYGFDFGTDRARIIVPLHQPIASSTGTVEVAPIQAGDLPIAAAIFRREGDRNVVLWRSPLITKPVIPGPASLSVWQEASSAAPQEVRESNDGRWTLRIYPSSYEVLDRHTGDLVIRRAGTKPKFSPTQRFLTADTPPEAQGELIDLVARRVVRRDIMSFVVWLHQDSIALVDGYRNCSILTVQTLTDGSDVSVGEGAGSCDAWTGSQVDLNLDSGYVANSLNNNNGESWGFPNVDSLTRIPIDITDTLSRAQIVPFIKSRFDSSYGGPPHIWRVHDTLKITAADLSEFYKDARRFLISTSRTVQTTIAGQSGEYGPAREPITRGLGPIVQDDREPTVLESSLTRLLGASSGPLVFAERAVTVETFAAGAPPLQPTNTFGRPAIPIADRTTLCAEVAQTGHSSFERVGDLVFELQGDRSTFPNEIAFWPGSDHLAAVSFVDGGTADGSEETRIMRQQPNGQWLADCRHSEMPANYTAGAHAGEIPPEAFRFPAGDVALLYAAFHQLILSPAVQTDPICNMRDIRQPEALQTLARLGANHVLLIDSTGDLDIFECPSGRHVISGALLDDELVVYADQGWFDGSAEAASFVQLRQAGVAGRYPLSEFEAALRRPGLLKEAMDGKPLPPVAIGDPPFVRLGSDRATVVASDAKGLAALRFYDDGVMVAEMAVSGRQGTVPIPAGKLIDARQPVVVAVNTAGIKSAPLALPAAAGVAARKGHLIGLAVGVDSYKDARIPQLGFAEHDATALAAALSKGDRGHLDNTVTALTGQAVSAAAVLAAVQDRIASATPADTLVFSFAGHATDQNGALSLIMPETDLDRLDATALRWSDLEATLAKSPARIVIFLDACHSGSAALGSGEQHEAAVSRLNSWRGPPMLIFAASKGGQYAIESAAAGGGLFTAALVEALLRRPSGVTGPQQLSLNDLYTTVKRKVLADSQGLQIPWFGRRGLLGDFVLF